MALIDCFKENLSQAEFDAIQQRLQSKLDQNPEFSEDMSAEEKNSIIRASLGEIVSEWENSLYTTQETILNQFGNQNLEQDEKGSDETVDPNQEQETDQGAQQSEQLQLQREEEEINSADRQDEADAQDEAQRQIHDAVGLRPDEPTGDNAGQNAKSQSAFTNQQVEEITTRVNKLIEGDLGEVGNRPSRSGIGFDEAFDEVMASSVDDILSGNVNVGKLKTAVEAKRREFEADREKQLTSKTPYADFSLGNWDKFKQWYKKNIYHGLRSTGAMTPEQFKALERKRGFIQTEVGRIVTLGKKLTNITRKLSEVDKEGVDKMLRGASPDVLSPNVNQETKEKISLLTKQMRDRIDGLSSSLDGLGILGKSFIDTVKNREGQYLNRVYLRNVDKNWSNKVSKKVFEDAKEFYRKEFIRMINDGRVLEENKQQLVRLLSSENNMDAYMRGLLEKGSGKRDFVVGGFEGTKDVGILRGRKGDDKLPKVIRDFYGEVRNDASANALNTVTKLASFIANTRLLQDLEAMGLGDGDFMSKTPRIDENGQSWVEINKSDSLTLDPLNSPIYVRPDIAEHLQIVREQLPKWIARFLAFNGAIKAGKTIFSPITQMRNIWSAAFWMMANGNWNPQNFKDALIIITAARKVQGIDKGKWSKAVSNLFGGEMSIEEANQMWERMVELQVADQNVVNKELTDFWKGFTKDDAISKFANDHKFIQKLVDTPRQIYSDADDFYRISYYLSQLKTLSKGLHKKPFAELNEKERISVEEEAATIVRDTYPNYSKIYPLVSKLRKFPFLGAFVSFSAEMIRTTRNQIIQMLKEFQTPGMHVSAMKRAVGLAAVTVLGKTLVEFGLDTFFGSEDFDEEKVKDMLYFRPPWVEEMIGLEDKGNGEFLYANPTVINPYGYFRDVYKAGENAEDGLLSMEGAAASIMKLFEPFLGLEVSMDVLTDVLAKAMDEGNVKTSGEKMKDAIFQIWEGLQPGFSYTAGRMRDAWGEQGVKAVLEEAGTTLGGVRRSPLNVPASFRFNAGPQLLREKRRARYNFNRVFYPEIQKLDPDIEGEPDYDLIGEAYSESVDMYNQYLDESREVVSKMRRLGVDEETIMELLDPRESAVNFDKTTKFSLAEIWYIVGQTDTKPPLIFQKYNGTQSNNRRSSSRRRGSRR